MSTRSRPRSLARLSIRAATIVAILAGAPSAAPQGGDTVAPASYGSRTTDSLLLEISTKRDDVDPGIFEALGVRRDRAALDALEEAIGMLFYEHALDPACCALSHFRGDPDLEQEAIRFLAALAENERTPRMHPAVRALVAFGSAAFEPLRKIVSTHPDPFCRRMAVGGVLPWLRARRDEDSLRMLLDWYRAPESGSREDLVRVLSEFDEPELMLVMSRTIEDEGADVQIRSVAVEALARMKSEGVVDSLLSALGSDEPSIQLAGIEALRSRGHREHARALERLVKSRHAPVRQAAFRALAEILWDEPGTQRRVLEAARDRDFALRLACVDLLARMADEEALGVLVSLLADPFHGVRVQAVDAVTSLRRKEFVPVLIERLAAETLRLQKQVHDSLALLTGLDFGLEATSWRSWWAVEGETFSLPTLETAVAAGQKRSSTLHSRATGTYVSAPEVQFYGLGLDSDRVCFVLDTSGSMAALVNTVDMRIDLVKRELLQAIQALPEDARFNLIFFSDHVDAWQKKLTEADERSRELASSFVERQGAGGGTALYDALAEAMEDPAVDTIVLLSDGEPTVGKLIDPIEIAEAVRTENAARRIVIHTISIAGAADDLMRDLAEQSGGEHREALGGR